MSARFERTFLIFRALDILKVGGQNNGFADLIEHHVEPEGDAPAHLEVAAPVKRAKRLMYNSGTRDLSCSTCTKRLEGRAHPQLLTFARIGLRDFAFDLQLGFDPVCAALAAMAVFDGTIVEANGISSVIAAERRLGEPWKRRIEARLFFCINDSDPFFGGFRNDGMAALQLSRNL